MHYCLPDPTLHEILSDEIVQVMMKADHVNRRSLEALIRTIGIARNAVHSSARIPTHAA